MKNKMMFGAAMIAAAITPAMAHADDTRGSIGVHYGNFDPKASGTDNLDQYGLDGSVSHDFGSGWTVQGDATEQRFNASGTSISSDFGAVSVGKNLGDYSLYGFVGLSSEVFALNATNFGVGGQFNPTSNIVLNGSVGYSNFEDFDAHALNYSVNGTYFFNDNLGVTAQIGHSKFDTSGPDLEGNFYGVSGTYRLSSCPVAFNLGYQKQDLDAGDVNVWRFGVNWSFGTSSARDAATHNWDGARTLHEQTETLVF